MSGPAIEAWQRLFCRGDAVAPVLQARFHLLRRRGEPLLLIPAETRLLRESLSLYPAQTWRARWARILVGVAARLNMPVLTEPFSLAVDAQAAFVKFASPEAEATPPPFAILFGNPKAAGRRLVMLVFDRSGCPARVIKIGMGAAAKELIRREAGFFTEMEGKLEGIPKMLGNFETADASAIALEYVPGISPTANDSGAAAKILGAWLDCERIVPITEFPAWQRLRQAAGAEALFHELGKSLSGARMRPAVFHGDFAPWNIRAKPLTGEWIVLDWERGETAGPPAWDWFHFVIQPMLLVAKSPAFRIAAEVERFLGAPEFLSYAARAQIQTFTRPLFLAYLLYCRAVLQPAEGRQATEVLLELLRRRWHPI